VFLNMQEMLNFLPSVGKQGPMRQSSSQAQLQEQTPGEELCLIHPECASTHVSTRRSLLLCFDSFSRKSSQLLSQEELLAFIHFFALLSCYRAAALSSACPILP